MEIGGYIEMEHYHRPMLYENGILLNSGRSCLSYLIKVNKITHIMLPYFICDSVIHLCEKENVKVSYYTIDENFMPQGSFESKDCWLYLVNYYGQLTTENILHYKEITNGKLILDNAQAYFAGPIEGVNTLYTCRKFFGVTDGAVLYSNNILDMDFPQDQSLNRMTFILGRYENSANPYYHLYQENNKLFKHEPIKWMSKITKNILSSINYTSICDRRSQNYNYLHQHLGKYNLIQPRAVEGAFAYPLLLKNGAEVRKLLAKQKIFIPLLWPNVLDNCSEDRLEYHYASNILPLPCDQRYDEKEMAYMVEVIKQYL